MPLRSALDMSDAMNSSGERPGRFSHSGTWPAEGAVRSGGDWRVERRAVGGRERGRGGENAVVVARDVRRARDANFIAVRISVDLVWLGDKSETSVGWVSLKEGVH